LNEEYADHVYLPIVKYILLMRLSMKSVLFFHAYELKVGKGLAFLHVFNHLWFTSALLHFMPLCRWCPSVIKTGSTHNIVFLCSQKRILH